MLYGDAYSSRDLLRALNIAVRGGQLRSAQILIDHGAPVNPFLHAGQLDKAPLMFAIRYERADSTRLLLDNGAHLGERMLERDLGKRFWDLAKSNRSTVIMDLLLEYKGHVIRGAWWSGI